MATASLNKQLPPGDGCQIDFDLPDTTLPMLLKLFRRFGDIYKMSSLQRQEWTYLINHPEYIRRVLGTNHRNYKKGVGFDRVNILLGKGLIVSEEDLWKRQRKMIQPMFHQQVLQGFIPLMSRCSAKLINKWQKKQQAGEAINITDEISLVALEFMLQALFSEDLDALVEKRGANPFLMVSENKVRDLQFARSFRTLSEIVKEFADTRIKENRRPFDLLSMLIDVRDKETGEAMPERRLIDEVLTFIVAGHETTASTLNWTWYLIAQYPEVEAELVREAETVLCKEPIEIDDLNRLEFTRQVLLESMRLYPPVWLLTRRAIGEDKVGGFYVSPGTDILISPYIIHRHPEFWEQPEKFRPERFQPEIVRKRPPGAYLPFSMGPRKCIGETLSMYEMLLHVGTVIKRFRLKLTENHDDPVGLEAQVNLRPKHDIYMIPENPTRTAF